MQNNACEWSVNDDGKREKTDWLDPRRPIGMKRPRIETVYQMVGTLHFMRAQRFYVVFCAEMEIMLK